LNTFNILLKWVQRMSEPSLKAEIWIKAQIRLCDINLIPAMVTRRGDSDAGAILLKLNRLDAGVEVFCQTRDTEGNHAWMRGTGEGLVSDIEAEAYIAKQMQYDPDIWVLEIEDPNIQYVIESKII
jgi:hypothetical protein